MTKSISISQFTMPAALAAADAVLGETRWSSDAGDPGQVAWLEKFPRRAGLASMIPEIRRNATEVLPDHVAWLQKEGWDAQITQGAPGELYLAATLNLTAKWRQAGMAYRYEGIDRARVEKGVFASFEGHGKPSAVMIRTQGNDRFYLWQAENAPANRDELLARAVDMTLRAFHEEVHVSFPMVNLRVRDDARYMIGLRSGPNIVTQAAEQMRLELNEVGGRASAAAEVAVSRGLSMTRTVEINGPFLVAVWRDIGTEPADKVAFAAWCDRDSWGKPDEGRI